MNENGAEDRNVILSHFQECTSMYDFDRSLAWLEDHNWKVNEAIDAWMLANPDGANNGDIPNNQRAIGTSQSLEQGLGEGRISNMLFEQSDHVELDSFDNSNGAQAGPDIPTITYSGASFPSTSSEHALRMLTLNVSYLGSKPMTLYVPDNETVGSLKQLLEQEFGVPKAEQEISGWMTGASRYINDKKMLRELNLPSEVDLLLSASLSCAERHLAQLEEEKKEREMMNRLSQDFTLNIRFADDDVTQSFKFQGSKTIAEVKEDIALVCKIIPRKQEWVGWPHGAEMDTTTTLAACDINYPVHDLVVRSAEAPRVADIQVTHRLQNVDSDSDSESLEGYGTPDDMMEENNTPATPAPLMPEDATDQTQALESFVRGFAERYGEVHPVFYIGKLEDALSTSIQCKARERRMLAVYLHHDKSIMSNVFCSQVLCHPTVVDYLSHNFIVWAWDLTSKVNKERLLAMVAKHVGSVMSSMIRNLKPDELPLLMLISRNRATNEVVQYFSGDKTVDELIPQLMHCHEVFKQRQGADIAEEDAREAREKIKREQEEAYQESLEADRAKAVARQMEQAEQREKEEELERQRQEDEELRQREITRRENRKQQLASGLPAEPAEDCKEPVATLRLRHPRGSPIVRRFLGSHTLQVLLDFMGSQGYESGEYKLLTTFPRKDLTIENPEKCLQELKLCPQETLTVEEK